MSYVLPRKATAIIISGIIFTSLSLGVIAISKQLYGDAFTESDTPAVEANANYLPRLLVKKRNNISNAKVSEVTERYQLKEKGKLEGSDVEVIELPPTAEKEDYQSYRQAVERTGLFEYVELDQLLTATQVTPNDPSYSSQQSLGQIELPTAWSTTTGSSSIIIAVVDGGVKGDHPDLAAKMVPGWNMLTGTNVTTDSTGHGTVVAGAAAAVGNNGIGVASPDWNAKIMPIKVTADGSASVSVASSGIRWAADHGARVVNLSFGYVNSSTLNSAAQYLRSKGGILISGITNAGTTYIDADNPYITHVSSTDSSRNHYSYSGQAPFIDLAAPGAVYTTQSNGGYGGSNANSFSAPQVAGVAALILAKNPGLTATQLDSVLYSTARDLGNPGRDNLYGFGEINAAAAVAAAGNPQGDTTAPTVSFLSPVSGATVTSGIMVSVSASDNVAVASVALAVDGQTLSTDTSSPYSFFWDTTKLSNGSHQLKATATDTSSNSANTTINVTVSNAPDTVAPIVSITSPLNGAAVSGNVNVVASATDNIGVARVEFYVDDVLKMTDTTGPYVYKWNTRKITSGTHRLYARAYDAAGNVTTSSVITVTR